MHEPMSARREAIVRREMADTTYAGTWHIRENDTGELMVWEVTLHGKVLATLPDWAGNLAMWIADARDDVPQLLALVTQLRADGDETRTKLEIAERRVDELATTLVERDEQIAGLLAAEVTDDEPAGVPW